MSIGSAFSPRATSRQGQRERLGSLVPGFLGANQGGYSNSSQTARTRLPWPLQAARDLPQHGLQLGEKLQQGQPLTPNPRFRLRRSAQQQPPQDLPPMLESASRTQGNAFTVLGDVRQIETLPQGALSRTPRETRVERGRQVTPRRGARHNRSILASEPNPFEHEKVDDGDMTKITGSRYNATGVSKEVKLSQKLYNFMRASNAEGCANLFTTIVSRDEHYGSLNPNT